MDDAIDGGEEASVEFFNEWVENVKKTVPNEKLLVFNVKEGWEPLCQFLNLSIPKTPFPNTNDTQMLKRRLKERKLKAYIIVLGLPLLFGIGITFYYFKDEISSCKTVGLEKILEYVRS